MQYFKKLNGIFVKDESAHQKIDKEINDREQAIQNEAQTREQAIQNEANARTEAIQNETQARTQAIQNEVNARTQAIQNEVNARTEAIQNETQARTQAIEQLASDEATAREEAINTVVNSVNDITNIKRILYPPLPDEYKTAIYNLCDEYQTQRNSFIYKDDHNRNQFAGVGCYDSTSNKFKFNCSSFIQSIWMGRSIQDFVNKNGNNYTNIITKAFDFGYYFNFMYHNKLHGVAQKNTSGTVTSYYGFKQPNDDSLVGSYSRNTYYNEDSSSLWNQTFNDYMNANDMAKELYEMGCEIPFSELDVGDLIFIAEPRTHHNTDGSAFNEIAWKNITHVAIVKKKFEDGDLAFLDCQDYSPYIVVSYLNSSSNSDKTYAGYLRSNTVFCARLPIAWGIQSNVPERITSI